MKFQYLFLTDGDEPLMHEGQTVEGAEIEVNIQLFRDGKDVTAKVYEEEAKREEYSPSIPSVSDIVKVSFNRETAFTTEWNPDAMLFFREKYHIDRFEYPVTKDGFALSVCKGSLREVMPDVAADLGDEHLENAPVSESAPVSEEFFRKFLIEHADYFDNSDNKCAQCPSYTPEKPSAAE